MKTHQQPPPEHFVGIQPADWLPRALQRAPHVRQAHRRSLEQLHEARDVQVLYPLPIHNGLQVRQQGGTCLKQPGFLADLQVQEHKQAWFQMADVKGQQQVVAVTGRQTLLATTIYTYNQHLTNIIRRRYCATN